MLKLGLWDRIKGFINKVWGRKEEYILEFKDIRTAEKSLIIRDEIIIQDIAGTRKYKYVLKNFKGFPAYMMLNIDGVRSDNSYDTVGYNPLARWIHNEDEFFDFIRNSYNGFMERYDSNTSVLKEINIKQSVLKRYEK